MKRVCAVLAVAVLALVLAGCGSSGSAGSGAPTTSSSPGAARAPSGTLTIGTFGGTQSFDPALASFTSDIYLTTPYDSLLRQDSTGKLIPGLATKWSQPDPSTWTFTLRSGVTFSDGTPFNAAAVKANLQHMKTTPGPNQYAFADITGIETPSAHQVTVHFSQAAPSFATVMSTTRGVMASPKAIADGTLAKQPVGTGGWTYDAGASQAGVKYVFDANPDYWDKADQGVKTVEIDVMSSNNARQNALLTGAAQVVNLVPAQQVAPLKGKGATIVKTHNPYAVVLFLGDRNGKLVKALGNAKVRKAMNLAINRKALLKTLSAGVGSAASTLFAPGSAWYDPANADVLAYDLAKAKKLMAQAGYANGFTMHVPVFAATQTWNEAVAQQLAKINIKVVLDTVPPGQAGPEFRQQKYPATWGGVGSVDPFDFWQQFVAKSGGWDPFGVSTAKIDALALKGAAQSSKAEQKKTYAQMEKLILDEGIFLVLGQTYSIDAVADSVKGQPYLYNGEITVRPQGLRVG